MSDSSQSPQVRVRFAPSPTGFLHIGGARTALFNFLYARRHGGKFLLRIEDTDTERSEERFTKEILDGMKWMGLHWDEEILYQSRRFDVYRAKVDELLNRDLAYRCDCSTERLDQVRAEAMKKGEKPKYDGHCRDRDIKPESSHVVRVRIPEEGSIGFEDLIRGNVTVQNKELDDFIILRSNGSPTYQLVVVVDDVEMGMTHIVRGDDHLNNTPKQLHLYSHFEFPKPKFAHLPMILGEDKKKLSKRHGAVSVTAYREAGYLPQALVNFLVRLGWSHGDQEVFSLEEMIQAFDFDHVQKSPAVFNTEKLQWLNGSHIRSMAPEGLVELIRSDYSKEFSEAGLKTLETDLGRKLVQLVQPKDKSLQEMVEKLAPLCETGVFENLDLSGLKWNKKPELKEPILKALEKARVSLAERVGSAQTLGEAGLGHEEIGSVLKEIAKGEGVKLGDLMQPMRLFLTGKAVSVGVFELLEFYPWDIANRRIESIPRSC